MTGTRDGETGLTIKQRAVVHGVLEGKTQERAAIDAGYSPASARATGSEIMRRPDTLAYMRKCLSEAGLTPESIASKLTQGINEANQYALSRDGTAVTLGPDWHARAKMLDMAMKAQGGYPDPRIEQNVGTQNVLVIRPEQSPLAALDPFSQTQE